MKKLIQNHLQAATAKIQDIWKDWQSNIYIYDGYVRWGCMGRSAKEIEQIREFQRKN